MPSLFIPVVVIIGLIIYFKKPQWLLLYWIAIEPVIYPFFVLSIADVTILQETHGYNAEARRDLVFIIIVIEFFKTRKIPNGVMRILTPLLVIFIYLLINNFAIHPRLARAGTLTGGIGGTIVSLTSLVSLLILLCFNPNLVPSRKVAINFILLLLGYELIWMFLNIKGIYSFTPFNLGFYYDSNGHLTSMEENNLIQGSFLRFNKLSNFLTTIYLFIAIEYFLFQRIRTKPFMLIAFVMCLMVLATGARMSVLQMGFITLMCSVMNYRRYKSFVTAICVLGVVIIVFLTSITDTDITPFDGVNRVLEGLSGVFQGKGTGAKASLNMSGYLMEHYFYANPLFGNGLSYQGENAYRANMMNTTLTLFRADSTVVYYLVEYGIFGFLIFFSLLFKSCTLLMVGQGKRVQKAVIATLLYFSLLTITEIGFFDPLCFPLTFIYFFTLVLNNGSDLKYIALKGNNQ